MTEGPSGAAGAPEDGRSPAASTDKAAPAEFITWYSVCMIALASVFSSIDRTAITLMVTPVKRDLGLSDTEISLVIGLAYSVIYVLAGLPLARLADSWSRKRMLSIALATWSLATAVCAFAQSFLHLFACRAVVGAGTSVKGPVSISWISDLVQPRQLPRAYAILNLAVYGGFALAMIITGTLLGWLGTLPDPHVPGFGVMKDWQLTFIIISVPGILFAVLLLLTVPETMRAQRRARGTVPIREIVRYFSANARVFVPLILMAAIYSIDDGGLTVWRPTFFERTYGWPVEQIGPLLGLSLMISTVAGLYLGTLLVEWLARRHADANLRAAFCAQMVGLPFMVFGLLAPNGWAALVLMTIGGTFAVAGGPGQMAALQLVTPNGMRSQIAGLYLLVISLIGGAFGPFLIGSLTDLVFESESLLRYSMVVTIVVVTPSALLLNWFALKPYGRLYRAQQAG